jgi:hypothetical protein
MCYNVGMLYLLRPRKDLPLNANPWEPWYDKCFGMVVRADSEAKARSLAMTTDCEEGETAWTAEFSTCEVLDHDGAPEVIIKDEHRA